MYVYLWTTVCVLNPFIRILYLFLTCTFIINLQTKIFINKTLLLLIYLQYDFKRNLKLIGATYISKVKTPTNISQNFISFTGKQGGGGVKDKSIHVMRVYFLDVQHHSTKTVWSNEDAIFHQHCRALPYAYAIPLHRHLTLYIIYIFLIIKNI